MSKISVGRIVTTAKSAISAQQNKSMSSAKGLIGDSNSEMGALLKEVGFKRKEAAGFDGDIAKKAESLVNENKLKEFRQDAERKANETAQAANAETPDPDEFARQMEAEAQATISKLETEGSNHVPTI